MTSWLTEQLDRVELYERQLNRNLIQAIATVNGAGDDLSPYFTTPANLLPSTIATDFYVGIKKAQPCIQKVYLPYTVNGINDERDLYCNCWTYAIDRLESIMCTLNSYRKSVLPLSDNFKVQAVNRILWVDVLYKALQGRLCLSVLMDADSIEKRVAEYTKDWPMKPGSGRSGVLNPDTQPVLRWFRPVFIVAKEYAASLGRPLSPYLNALSEIA